MAKKKEVQEVQEVVETAVVEKVVNNVTMQDGSVKNFGAKGKLLSSQDVTTSGFALEFYVVTGEIVKYEHQFGNEISALTAEMAAFGAASKIKAATAGSEVADLVKVITDKVEEYKQGIFVSRSSNGDNTSALTQIQTAYARVNGLNPEDQTDIAKVNAIFAALTKEEKSALYENIDIQIELAQIRLAAAQAAKAAMEAGV